MKILDGKIVRDSISKKISSDLKKLAKKPKLAIIQVGDDERSSVYVKQKKIFGENIGFLVEYIKLDQDISEKDLISKIKELNFDKSVDGIIVQLPVPKSINPITVIETIDPGKDVDGLNSKNLKFLLADLSTEDNGFIPATTKGILSLLDFYKIPIEGKKVVVVGMSLLVGRPTALAFLNRNATVTICHIKTKNLKKETKNADILVVAIGKRNFIKRDFVKRGQIIIDVGITKFGDSLYGDVDLKSVSDVVSAITPVPGGIGPMTVVSLFQNLLIAHNKKKKNMLI